MIKKAQATLEFALIFIIVVALILGLLVLWKWSKDNIPIRQGAFEISRVAAGTKTTAGKPEVYSGVDSPPEPKQMLR